MEAPGAAPERTRTADLKYERVLLKLSGESLAGDQGFGIAPTAVEALADHIQAVHEMGVALGVGVAAAQAFDLPQWVWIVAACAAAVLLAMSLVLYVKAWTLESAAADPANPAWSSLLDALRQALRSQRSDLTNLLLAASGSGADGDRLGAREQLAEAVLALAPSFLYLGIAFAALVWRRRRESPNRAGNLKAPGQSR